MGDAGNAGIDGQCGHAASVRPRIARHVKCMDRPIAPFSYRTFAVSSMPLTSAVSVELTGVSTPWRLPSSEM